MARPRKAAVEELQIPDAQLPESSSLSPITIDEAGFVAKTQGLIATLRGYQHTAFSDLEVFIKELAYIPSKSGEQGQWKTPHKVIKVACEQKADVLLADLLEHLGGNKALESPTVRNCLIWTLRCIVNLSSFQGFPTQFASLPGAADLANRILAMLRPENKLSGIDDGDAEELIKDCMNALYALTRFHGNCRVLECAGGVGILEHYLDSSDSFLKARCLLTLANIVGECDGEKVVDDYGAIPLIISFIEKSLDDNAADSQERKFCWLHEKLKYFFYLRDLLLGLQKLSVMEKNKKKIVDANGLEALVKVLNTGKDSELVLATKIIWNLSFDSNCRKAIMDSPALRILKDMCRADNKELRYKARGTLWRLSEEISAEPCVHKGDIMVSYCWAQQKIAIDLNKSLWARGYDLWMDVEQMSGSTLEAMAGAIENCRVVLICFSSDYKESPSCRSEAEYTYKLKKPFIPVRLEKDYRPDGWLGMMIGAKMYIDLTRPGAFDEAMDKLCAELGRVGTCRADKSRVISLRGSSGLPSLDLRGIEQWTETEALEFMAKNNVLPERVKKFFGEITGRTLKQLQYMQKTVPMYLYTELKLVGMNFEEIVTFSAALNELNT